MAVLRRIVPSGAFVGALLALQLASASADDAEGFAQKAFAGQRSQAPVARMRLGFPPDRWQATNANGDKPRPTRAERCRRWQEALASLGETYAGHALRRGLVARHCAMTASVAASTLWEWPWNGLGHHQLAPPRHHRTFKAWNIRCGSGGHRARCALVHTPAPEDDGDLAPGRGPRADWSAHFVIDRVAGREMLLWRVHVAADRLPDRASRKPAGWVRFHVGRLARKKSFSVCESGLCLMEAGGRLAGRVATRLAGGLPLQIAAGRADLVGLRVLLPASGFRQGLAELARLRKTEVRR